MGRLGWVTSEIVHSTLAKELAVEVGDPVSLSLVQQIIKLAFSAVNILVTTLACTKNEKEIKVDEESLGPDSNKEKVEPKTPLKESDWKTRLFAASGGILIVGIIRLLGKVLNQKALITVTNSFINTVTVTGPVFALVLSYVILGERPTRAMVLSILPIVLGLSLSTFTELEFVFIGFICAVFSTGLFNLSNAVTKKVIKDTGVNLNHLLLLTDIVTFTFLLPPWYYNSYNGGEGWDKIMESPELFSKNVWTGFFSFLHTLLSMNILANFTALSYSVLNVFKRLVIIVGSVLYFGNTVTPLNQLGILIASAGVLYYSKLKVEHQSK